MNRHTFLNHLKALGIWSIGSDINLMASEIMSRKIPSTGELIPCVGLGTWQTFDVSSPEEQKPLMEVLKTLIAQGGRVVDSSPMYGQSEQVVGELSSELKINNKLFIATKVWTHGKENGIRQMNESFRLLRRKNIDLMQIHNLTDWETQLKTLRDMKAEGKIKYLGLTHYANSVHDKIAGIIAKEKVDFIQINYNLLDRHAEEKLLPFAQDQGVAVIINRPFKEGDLFKEVKGKQVPPWAREFDCKSWGQFFLKFILSHPAVTCAIPGTDKPHHMLDNLGAGFGKMPTAKQRQRMIAELQG